jgi:glutathione S-transferase
MTAPERTTIKLYTQVQNPFTEKVAAALGLKKLAFERVVSEDPEDVKRWSPIARTLPVLEIDGRRKADSASIIEWIDTLFPAPPLVARDAKTAEAQRNLAEWSDTSFAWYWNQWRAARFPQPGDEAPVDVSLLGKLIKKVGRSFGHKPLSRADVRELQIVAKLEDRFEDLVGFLRDRPFFYADEPSIADLSVYSMLKILEVGPIPHCQEAIAERPTLVGFIARMNDQIASVERLDLGPED